MRKTFTASRLAASLAAAGVALTLSCVPGVTFAALATTGITGFSVTTTPVLDPTTGGPAVYVWAPTDFQFQNWGMTALNAGGLNGASSNTYSANDWNPVNRIATTSAAQAKGDTIQFTDAATQLGTVGFNLSGKADQTMGTSPTPPNRADANALQSGAFTLIDAQGNFVGGDLTFTIFYDLDVTSNDGNPSNYAQSLLNLLASDDGGESFSGSDELLSSNLASGAGSKSGAFTFTFNLAAGESAFYTLSGSAIAAATANVPEPATLLLALAALGGAASFTRRRKAPAAAV